MIDLLTNTHTCRPQTTSNEFIQPLHRFAAHNHEHSPIDEIAGSGFFVWLFICNPNGIKICLQSALHCAAFVGFSVNLPSVEQRNCILRCHLPDRLSRKFYKFVCLKYMWIGKCFILTDIFCFSNLKWQVKIKLSCMKAHTSFVCFFSTS